MNVYQSLSNGIISGVDCPLYTSETAEPDDFIEIMLQAHVSVNLFAHKHSYERICHTGKQKCVSMVVFYTCIHYNRWLRY